MTKEEAKALLDVLDEIVNAIESLDDYSRQVSLRNRVAELRKELGLKP